MPDATCSVAGCESPVTCRGWCNRHYLRWRKYGDPHFTKYLNARGPLPMRQMRAGDPPPTVEPRRFYNAQGYVRLRWYLPDVVLECYEHRWVVRCFDPALHVHHRNGVKDDNRPENLEIVTPQEHRAEHRVIDREQAKALYAQGLSIPAVARAMGHDSSAVYRLLVAEGVEIRPGATYNRRAAS